MKGSPDGVDVGEAVGEHERGQPHRQHTHVFDPRLRTLNAHICTSYSYFFRSVGSLIGYGKIDDDTLIDSHRTLHATFTSDSNLIIDGNLKARQWEFDLVAHAHLSRVQQKNCLHALPQMLVRTIATWLPFEKSSKRRRACQHSSATIIATLHLPSRSPRGTAERRRSKSPN
jgi:hypothetical protein